MAKEHKTVYQINIWATENEDCGSIQFYALGNGEWVLEENSESWERDFKHLCKGTFTECVKCLHDTYDIDILRTWK